MSQEFELYFEMVDEADCGREFRVFRNSSGEIVHEEVHCDEDFGLVVTSCVYINGEHLTGDGWRLLEGAIGLDKVFEAHEQGVDIFAFMTDFDEQADSDEDGLRLWSEALRKNQERLSSESAREIEAGFSESSAEMNARPRTGGSPCL